jgi:hypothetical protein
MNDLDKENLEKAKEEFFKNYQEKYLPDIQNYLTLRPFKLYDNSSNIAFQEKYILYIDILGFEELMTSKDMGFDDEKLNTTFLEIGTFDMKKGEEYKKFNNINSIKDLKGFKNEFEERIEKSLNSNTKLAVINFLRDTVHLFKEKEKDIKIRSSQFSDTIIATSEKLENLVIMASTIQALGLVAGCVVRGSLVKGAIYHNKSEIGDVFYGEGLIKAYKLEKQATYPRILVEKSLVKSNKEIVKDFDGLYYVDIEVDSFNQSVNKALEADKQNTILKTVRLFIVSNLQKYKDKPRLYRKYYWLREKWNEKVGEEFQITIT